MAYNRQQQARINNAMAIGRRMQQKLADGWIILDGEGERITQIETERNGVPAVVSVHKSCSIIYFEADPERDHGLELSIREFNAIFAKWVMIPPNAYRSVIRAPKQAQRHP